MKKKKVVYIVESFGSGVFSFLVNLINSIDNDFDITIVYGIRKETPQDFKKYFSDKVNFIEVKNFTRKINLFKDYKAFKEIKSIVGKIKPDIVHLHSSKAGVIGRFAVNGRKTKVIYNPHGFSFLKQDDNQIKRFIYKILEKIAALRKSTIVACSVGEYKEALKLSKNSICINNGIDINKTKENVGNIANREIDFKNIRICTSGRITYQKNPQMFNKIAEAFPNINFTWIGDGDLKDVLKSKNITITGWKTWKEGVQILNDNDIFLLPSLWEGLPITLLEAMYIRKVCIVSNVIGNRDVVQNGINGIIADKLEEYIEAINNIIDGKVNSEEIICNAHNDIINKYSTEKINQEYIKLYNS